MPTTYAHYRFGRDVLMSLSPEMQHIIESHCDLFHFGVHGPDLLFYYKPFRKNTINQLGCQSHERTGRDFFSQFVKTAQNASQREASLSYLYGVLCHFILDRECHPYVGQKEKEGVSHSAIESSFDRYLMELDGLDPVKHRVTSHLHPSFISASIIAPFYPPLSAKQLYRTEKSMVFYLNMLIASGAKRKVLLCGMKLAGHSELGDMFVPLQQNPSCVDSDKILFEHYQDALNLSKVLFPQLDGYMNGTADLGSGFDHTFGEA